ncbi:hypothetical protein ACWD6U_00410 [Streptomyces sp. NPDC005149]
MKQTEPDFWVVEYATITQDPRTDLVIAIGGTEKAADILQRTGGFLSAAWPRPPGGVEPGGTYMANLADEYGTDVEIYIKALTTTIHADTPTGAPARLHDLLEQLGLERHEYPTSGLLYIWHTVPEHLGADEQMHLATRAIPALLVAGYEVNCTPDVFDEAAYRQAVRDFRTRAARPATQHPAPAGSPSRPAPARHTP